MRPNILLDSGLVPNFCSNNLAARNNERAIMRARRGGNPFDKFVDELTYEIVKEVFPENANPLGIVD